jgi:hypothetical protein
MNPGEAHGVSGTRTGPGHGANAMPRIATIIVLALVVLVLGSIAIEANRAITGFAERVSLPGRIESTQHGGSR